MSHIISSHFRNIFRQSSSSGVRFISQHFRVIEHVAKCQHTRDRPAGAELGTENRLRLSVKQYVPKHTSHPGPNDVTLIGAHANGFPKELYEPLWDDMYEALLNKGKSVRSVWIVDQYSQGQSGVLNERILGNDPSWWDHGRDLLYVINQFQDEIPHPIMGIGHSMGGLHLAHLALMHPRLLDALVLVDPVIQIPNPSRPYALASTYRRDLWPSRSDAAKKFAGTAFYQKWDERVLQNWIEYGLRDLPTEQYPTTDGAGADGQVPVTLTTTKAQEVYAFLRPAYHEERMLLTQDQHDDGHQTNEMHPEDIDDFPMYRPEPPLVFRDLKHLRPSTLYVFGETSELSDPVAREQKVATTGTGLGGSGGKSKGLVEEVVLECGHLVPMERTTQCADAIADFIARQFDRYDDINTKRKAQWEALTRKERVEINDKWRATIGEPPKKKKKTSNS